MLNFKIKVAQRYFIWPVLRFCRVPYRWLKQSSGRECQSRGKYWQNEDRQLSADWESSVTVISADQQKEHTLLFQTIVNLIFTLFYNFNLWKILYRIIECLTYSLCVLHEPVAITVHSFNRQPCTVPLDWWSAKVTGTLGSQSSGELFSRRPCTVPLDCWSTEITGTLDSQSAESTGQRNS